MFKWISRWWYEEKYDKEPEKEEPEACEAREEPERELKKSYLDVVKEIVEDEPPPVPPRN